MSNTLMLGVSRQCITPPIGTPLYGYPVHRPAQKVGDDLNVIAAAFVCGETKAILLAADICSCTARFTNQLRAEIEAKTGFPGSCIIFNCSHTHSGPNTSERTSGWGNPDMTYINEILFPKSVEAAVQATSALRPALFGVATTECNVGINRRWLMPDGKVELGQNPWGVMDKEMTVMSFVDPETREPLLNMVHYGCHGTAAARSIEITRDWPGAMKDVLERETGAITMFIQGAIGECGPRCPNGRTAQSYPVALELGYQAGHDAVRAWKSIKEWRNVPVNAICGDVTVPYEPLMSKEEAQAAIDKLGSEEELWAQDKRMEINELLHLKAILGEYAAGEPKTHFVYPQCILSIGPVAIVPFPMEIFFYISMQLRRYSKFTHTLSLSNSNGTLGYLPSQDQICRGGYEVWQFRYFNTYKMVDDADTHLVTGNLKLLDEMFEQPTNK